jgi:PPM family protein phosphatase
MGDVYLSNIRIESGKSSDKGMVRQSNEDSLVTLELFFKTDAGTTFTGLYAVADGMGGFEDGEIASKIAIRTLSETVTKSLVMPALPEKSDSVSRELTPKLLGNAIQTANREVFQLSQKTRKGLGTTLTSLLLVGSDAVIANVGDSRIYLFREGILRQLTVDHSLVAKLVASGELKQEEVYTYPYRNIITRCLGTEPDIEIDLSFEEMKTGDIFLLCSDGLWEMIRDDNIRKVLEQPVHPQAACEQLVQTANQNGGADNISVIVVKITDSGRAA